MLKVKQGPDQHLPEKQGNADSVPVSQSDVATEQLSIQTQDGVHQSLHFHDDNNASENDSLVTSSVAGEPKGHTSQNVTGGQNDSSACSQTHSKCNESDRDNSVNSKNVEILNNEADGADPGSVTPCNANFVTEGNVSSTSMVSTNAAENDTRHHHSGNDDPGLITSSITETETKTELQGFDMPAIATNNNTQKSVGSGMQNALRGYFPDDMDDSNTKPDSDNDTTSDSNPQCASQSDNKPIFESEEQQQSSGALYNEITENVTCQEPREPQEKNNGLPINQFKQGTHITKMNQQDTNIPSRASKNEDVEAHVSGQHISSTSQDSSALAETVDGYGQVTDIYQGADDLIMATSDVNQDNLDEVGVNQVIGEVDEVTDDMNQVTDDVNLNIGNSEAAYLHDEHMMLNSEMSTSHFSSDMMEQEGTNFDGVTLSIPDDPSLMEPSKAGTTILAPSMETDENPATRVLLLQRQAEDGSLVQEYVEVPNVTDGEGNLIVYDEMGNQYIIPQSQVEPEVPVAEEVIPHETEVVTTEDQLTPIEENVVIADVELLPPEDTQDDKSDHVVVERIHYQDVAFMPPHRNDVQMITEGAEDEDDSDNEMSHDYMSSDVNHVVVHHSDLGDNLEHHALLGDISLGDQNLKDPLPKIPETGKRKRKRQSDVGIDKKPTARRKTKKPRDDVDNNTYHSMQALPSTVLAQNSSLLLGYRSGVMPVSPIRIPVPEMSEETPSERMKKSVMSSPILQTPSTPNQKSTSPIQNRHPTIASLLFKGASTASPNISPRSSSSSPFGMASPGFHSPGIQPLDLHSSNKPTTVVEQVCKMLPVRAPDVLQPKYTTAQTSQQNHGVPYVRTVSSTSVPNAHAGLLMKASHQPKQEPESRQAASVLEQPIGPMQQAPDREPCDLTMQPPVAFHASSVAGTTTQREAVTGQIPHSAAPPTASNDAFVKRPHSAANLLSDEAQQAEETEATKADFIREKLPPPYPGVPAMPAVRQVPAPPYPNTTAANPLSDAKVHYAPHQVAPHHVTAPHQVVTQSLPTGLQPGAMMQPAVTTGHTSTHLSSAPQRLAVSHKHTTSQPTTSVAQNAEVTGPLHGQNTPTTSTSQLPLQSMKLPVLPPVEAVPSSARSHQLHTTSSVSHHHPMPVPPRIATVPPPVVRHQEPHLMSMRIPFSTGLSATQVSSAVPKKLAHHGEARPVASSTSQDQHRLEHVPTPMRPPYPPASHPVIAFPPGVLPPPHLIRGVPPGHAVPIELVRGQRPAFISPTGHLLIPTDQLMLLQQGKLLPRPIFPPGHRLPVPVPIPVSGAPVAGTVPLPSPSASVPLPSPGTPLPAPSPVTSPMDTPGTPDIDYQQSSNIEEELVMAARQAETNHSSNNLNQAPPEPVAKASHTQVKQKLQRQLKPGVPPLTIQPPSKATKQDTIVDKDGNTLADNYMKNWQPTGRYKCKFCHYSSVTQNFLFRHWVMSHSGVKPYLCAFCNLKSPTKDGITRHQTSKHKELPRQVLIDGEQEKLLVKKFRKVFASLVPYRYHDYGQEDGEDNNDEEMNLNDEGNLIEDLSAENSDTLLTFGRTHDNSKGIRETYIYPNRKHSIENSLEDLTSKTQNVDKCVLSQEPGKAFHTLQAETTFQNNNSKMPEAGKDMKNYPVLKKKIRQSFEGEQSESPEEGRKEVHWHNEEPTSRLSELAGIALSSQAPPPHCFHNTAPTNTEHTTSPKYVEIKPDGKPSTCPPNMPIHPAMMNVHPAFRPGIQAMLPPLDTLMRPRLPPHMIPGSYLVDNAYTSSHEPPAYDEKTLQNIMAKHKDAQTIVQLLVSQKQDLPPDLQLPNTRTGPTPVEASSTISSHPPKHVPYVRQSIPHNMVSMSSNGQKSCDFKQQSPQTSLPTMAGMLKIPHIPLKSRDSEAYELPHLVHHKSEKNMLPPINQLRIPAPPYPGTSHSVSSSGYQSASPHAAVESTSQSHTSSPSPYQSPQVTSATAVLLAAAAAVHHDNRSLSSPNPTTSINTPITSNVTLVTTHVPSTTASIATHTHITIPVPEHSSKDNEENVSMTRQASTEHNSPDHSTVNTQANTTASVNNPPTTSHRDS